MLALFERRSSILLIGMIGATWPVWHWLTSRAWQDAGDAAPLLSLATAAILLWRRRDGICAVRARCELPTLLLLSYAASYPFVPPLARAILAMSAICAACSALWFRKPMDLRLWGLLLLSLPIIPTLSFYLGYPMRALVGDAASMLLQTNGLAVAREGTTLLWNGQQVSIDAPCSGIRMLWTGLYLSFALAALRKMNAARTLLLASLAVAIVMAANVLRATALFYVEAGITPQAQFAHELIGVVVFSLAAVGIAGTAAKMRGAHAI